MKQPEPDLRQRVALFRFGLVSQVVPLTAQSLARREAMWVSRGASRPNWPSS